ncbi:MAG: PTPDL family protein [Luteolibacter sp.]
MKKTPILAAFCLCSIALPCVADTFTLKDGTVLEGTIAKEEADSYLVEVQVTKSIKDERKIAKADVQKLDRAKPDLVAFVPIGKLVPTPDLLTADDYAQKIADVQKFIDLNHGSSKSKEAKAILQTLKTEAAAISAGGLKLNGKILTSAEYRANQYDLDARIAEAKIHNLVDSEQVLAALRAFADFDRDFSTTLSYGTLAPFMSRVITGYMEETKLSLAALDAKLKERETGLQRMAPLDRKSTEEAIKEENAVIEARYLSEKGGKSPWPTLSPYHKASMDDTIAYAKLELVRLAAVKTVLGVDGGKAYRDLHSAVKSGANAATLTAALAAAKSAMVPARYLDPLDPSAKSTKNY